MERSKEPNRQCTICGAAAEHSNYGAISCSPCKMFFRRNALTGREKFKCDMNGHCEVNINNRHICSACRLAKCFDNGMQPELIRSFLPKRNTPKEKANKDSERFTATSNILLANETETQPQEFPASNLQQSGDSTLYSMQWKLLSDVVYSYDESKLLSIGHRITTENSIAHSVTTTDCSLVTQLFWEVCNATEQYLPSNHNLCQLPADDRATFLHAAAESVTWAGISFAWKHCQLANCVPFITEFQNTHSEFPLLTLQRVSKHMETDAFIFKLALSLFTFCNNLVQFPPTIAVKPTSTLALFHIQNTYAEVTWKYLLFKYGLHHCIRRFTALIQCFLAMTEAIDQSQSHPAHVNDVKTIVEKVELTLLLQEIERIDDIPSFNDL